MPLALVTSASSRAGGSFCDITPVCPDHLRMSKNQYFIPHNDLLEFVKATPQFFSVPRLYRRRSNLRGAITERRASGFRAQGLVFRV